jgi:hypothetical protein
LRIPYWPVLALSEAVRGLAVWLVSLNAASEENEERAHADGVHGKGEIAKAQDSVFLPPSVEEEYDWKLWVEI